MARSIVRSLPHCGKQLSACPHRAYACNRVHTIRTQTWSALCSLTQPARGGLHTARVQDSFCSETAAALQQKVQEDLLGRGAGDTLAHSLHHEEWAQRKQTFLTRGAGFASARGFLHETRAQDRAAEVSAGTACGQVCRSERRSNRRAGPHKRERRSNRRAGPHVLGNAAVVEGQDSRQEGLLGVRVRHGLAVHQGGHPGKGDSAIELRPDKPGHRGLLPHQLRHGVPADSHSPHRSRNSRCSCSFCLCSD